MIIPVIDTETTSIKPENGELLSFACVLEDTNNIKPVEELPYFYCVFKLNKLKGEPYALNMNRELIREISEGESENLINKNDFLQLFNNFLCKNKLSHHTSDRSFLVPKNMRVKGESVNVLYPSLPSGPKKPIKIKSCGKNFANFDGPWIREKIPFFNEYFQFHHRVLDPGSMFVDFKNDEWIPDLKECMVRSNVQGEVSHNALEDCYDLIKCLRTKY